MPKTNKRILKITMKKEEECSSSKDDINDLINLYLEQRATKRQRFKVLEHLDKSAEHRLVFNLAAAGLAAMEPWINESKQRPEKKFKTGKGKDILPTDIMKKKKF